MEGMRVPLLSVLKHMGMVCVALFY